MTFLITCLLELRPSPTSSIPKTDLHRYDKIPVSCKNGKGIIPFSPILQPPHQTLLEIDSSEPPIHTRL